MFNDKILINKNKSVFKSYPLKLYFGKLSKDEDFIKQRLLFHLELTGQMSLVDYEHIMGKLAIYITDDEFSLFPVDKRFFNIRQSIKNKIISQRYEANVNPNKIYTPKELQLLNEMQIVCVGRVHGFFNNFYFKLLQKFSSANYVPNGINVKPGTYKTRSNQREIIKAILEARNGYMNTATFCQIVNKLVINITDMDILLIPREYPRIRYKVRRMVDVAKFEATIWIADTYSKAQLKKMAPWKLFSLAKAHGIRNRSSNSLIKGNKYVIQQLMPIMRKNADKFYQVMGEFPGGWEK